MNASNTLSSLHISSHSFVIVKVLVALKVISRIFTAQPRTAQDFSSSLCPLL